MGKSAQQKALLAAYKERTVVGGVCCVTCTENGRCVLLGAMELTSQRNRFQLALSTDTPLLPVMAADWRTYGSASFTFEVLEELERTPDQSDAAFRADLTLLTDIWREKRAAEGAIFYC